MPPVPEAEIPDRHLGLVTADELSELREKIDRLADAAEEGIDLHALCALAQTAKPLTDTHMPLARATDFPVRVAVAKDRAFCFYNEDNFDVLRELGAELVPFSPLTDERLPEHIDGLYLGGGYPELYEKQLSENEIMRDSIKTAILSGLPTVAECGGFLYLLQSLDGAAMAGVLPTSAHMTHRLQPFGYVTLTANSDNLLCEAGGQFPVHEFHYAQAVDNGTDFRAVKPNGRAWDCGFASDTLYAGFPHLYFREENNRRASGNIRHRLTENTRKLHNRVLQKTQSAERHGNICKTISRRRHAFLIQRPDGRNSLFKCHFPLLSAHFRTKFAAISVFARKYKCGNPA